ncbi:MAG: TrpB-like pyridoxal phosphate-dependent enzyme, partial [Candidatus Hydrothermae bacterium]|nr:TrpB-like pyridoxal phosphate-dependent enzyme [Candidatus Hydrothermae bacterium]
RWYNLLADLPFPLDPARNPATGEPLTPDALAPLFPRALIEQEALTEREVDIPDPVREAYRLWRPTPLVRARRWEAVLQTPARIYFKYEGVSPVGSHKPNTAVPQAFYNREEGIRKLTTETGAGQWGSALSFASALFGLACEVYMVRISYQQKPYRRILMETFGAEVIPSPSDRTQAGRAFVEKDPDHPGSLGIAISEAVEAALQREDTHYSLGSVLNHVLLHQTVIGLEVQRQLEKIGVRPDVLIGAAGGGSNFAGLTFPFVGEMLREQDREKYRVIAVEPEAAPTLTRGVYAYDFGDTAGMTPLLPMYTLGHAFVPPPIHAGGLRYHGMAPVVSALYREGYIQAVAVKQQEVFEAAVEFTRAQGIVPAPESAHAVKVARDEAIRAREEGVARVIVFNLSGHGHFDLLAYEQYLQGTLEDSTLPEEALKKHLEVLPRVEA